MLNKLYYKLELLNEVDEVLGKIEAFSQESLQEQLHKLEKVEKDNQYSCDTCEENYPISELIELDEDTHICEECNEAEPEPTQQDLD